MKPLLPLILSFLALCSCTSYETNDSGHTVKFVSMARNRGLTISDANGKQRLHIDDNDNVAVWDAAGRFIGNIGAAAAETLLAHGAAIAVAHGASNGVQLLTAAVPPTVQHVTNRNTNRVAATPAPTAPVKP